MRVGDLLKTLRSVALAIALVLVVVLARQNRSLRAELTRVRLQAHIPPVGLTVPEFRAVTITGDSVTIGRAASAQVLFFFSTTCAFCRQTLPAWDSVMARVRRATPGLAVFGLTQDPDFAVRAWPNMALSSALFASRTQPIRCSIALTQSRSPSCWTRQAECFAVAPEC